MPGRCINFDLLEFVLCEWPKANNIVINGIVVFGGTFPPQVQCIKIVTG